MTAFAIVTVVWFSRRSHQVAESDFNEWNTQVFKLQLAELEKLKAVGQMTDSDYHLLKIDLEQSLLTEIKDSTEKKMTSNRQWLFYGFIFNLFLAAIIFYYSGYRGIKHDWYSMVSEYQPMVDLFLENEKMMPDVNNIDVLKFSRVLQKQLKTDKISHARGWFFSGVVDLQQQNLDYAKQALTHANRLKPNQPNYMYYLAQALITLNQGQLNAKSQQLLMDSIRLQPDFLEAMSLLGMSAFTNRQYALAVIAWQQMLAYVKPDSTRTAMIKSSIVKAQSLIEK